MVKTSTGFAEGSAIVVDIDMIVTYISITTSVSIGNYETAMAIIEASAERIRVSGEVEVLVGVPE